jgi:hypothetical protein
MLCKAAPVFIAVSLLECSSQRSDVRLARSLAAESEMFAGYVIGGHATRRYAEEHASYLEDAVEQLVKEAGTSASRTNLLLLRGELSRVRGFIVAGDQEALAAAESRIRKIRENLEKASAKR